MAIALDDSRINPEMPEYDEMLNDLQGNILKGHGRDFTAHMFLRFRADNWDKTKEFIQMFAEKDITSAKQQLQQSAEYSSRRIRGQSFINFCLSAKGYEFFGLPVPGDPKFQAGMKNSSQDLNDPSPENWDEWYRGDIHAMILLANDSEITLHGQSRQVLLRIKKDDIADILGIEYGVRIKDENDEAIEHFGYADGISQPLFLKDDIDKAEAAVDTSTYDRANGYDPSAPLRLVLVQDPNGQSNNSFGSYLVFRKLEQNVRGFKESLEKLADILGLKGEEARARAGAMVVGRFEDGTPVTSDSMKAGSRKNDFDYSADDGTKCPLHAHIRKTNPRGETVMKDLRYGGAEELEQERAHRIVRRGITYGRRDVEPSQNPLPEECPTAGVGLLFMCFQSDITNQFEYIQKHMVNDPEFPNPGTGLDPVIGQGQESSPQNWPMEWGKPDDVQFNFGKYVTLKGGEYFFVPSISFLKNLEQSPSFTPARSPW